MEAIPDLVAQLPGILSAIVEFVTTMLPEIAKQGARIIVELAAGIIGSLPELLSQLPKVAETLLEGLSSLPDSAVEIGASILEGIWEGIQNTAGWLVDKLSSWADSIMQDVKDFFGIHSPSAVFRDEVGRYMAQGIGVGFEDEMASVASRMQRAIPTPTIDSIQDATAGAVNGLSAIMGNQRIVVEVPVIINGKELYRATLDDLRAVQKANPEVAKA